MFKYISNVCSSLGKWFTVESDKLNELDLEIREMIYRNVFYVLFVGVAIGVLITVAILH